MQPHHSRKRGGFTLVELTVVILIIGIIATVATPKFFDSPGDARENAATSSLTTIRNAISMYRGHNGEYPGTDEATFKSAVEPMLQNGIPACPVGNRDATVEVVANGTDPLNVTGDKSWIYNKNTGELRINHSDFIAL